MVETGQFDKILPFCKKSGYNPNYINILRSLVLVKPDYAHEFAKIVCNRDGGKEPLIPINSALEVFLENKNLV